MDGTNRTITRERDARLWSALIGADAERREEAARTICALEQEHDYSRELLGSIRTHSAHQRAVIGEAISLLGDPRFSPPYYLSEMLPIPSESAGTALSQMPVTNASYAVFVKATRHRSPRGWKHGQPLLHLRNAPVTWVSAIDAEAYCRWLSAETGYRFRLPTELDWLFAACGDDFSRLYPWGETFDDACANVWGRDAARRGSAVGLFPDGAGLYGHLDLIGNVWEWSAPSSATIGMNDEQRAMQGGSWRSKPGAVTCKAARQTAPPADSYEVAGFRLARSANG